MKRYLVITLLAILLILTGCSSEGSEGLEYVVNVDGKTLTVSGLGTCTDRNVVIPGKVKGKAVTIIGREAFKGANTIQQVMIPDTVTLIEDGAFQGCRTLTDIILPEGITTIEDEAFSGCEKLETLALPESVTSVGKYCFSGTSLSTIALPAGTTEIGESYFSGMDKLTEFTIPDGVTHIGEGAFFGCDGLTSIVLPNSVTHIGELAFCDCTKLDTVTFPDSCEIGKGAFMDSGLRKMIIVDKSGACHDSQKMLAKILIGCNDMDVIGRLDFDIISAGQ